MSDTGSVEPLVLTIKDKILLLVYVSKANLFDTKDCTVFNIHKYDKQLLQERLYVDSLYKKKCNSA